LKADDAKKWDSHSNYQNSMVQDGYIPIWWVTSQAALQAELSSASSKDAWAEVAVAALGLNHAKPGVYYAGELPSNESGEDDLHKPTILSGGFPNNSAAVLPRTDPGRTARLESGEPGLPEAVIPPLNPSSNWPALVRLGPIGRPSPDANTDRVKQRLA